MSNSIERRQNILGDISAPRTRVNPIINWLSKPRTLIVVCSVSFVVGVVTYVRSSSVHHLDEKFKLLAMIIFVCLLSFIFLASLFAYNFRDDPKPWVLRHFVFIVLELTTAYSFCSEKIEGKPDKYTLVSSGSFAIMSLCLSKLCYSDFEVDILSFYCTLFTLQLTKLKWYLCFVGAIFNYSLIMLRFYLPNPESSTGSVEAPNTGSVYGAFLNYSRIILPFIWPNTNTGSVEAPNTGSGLENTQNSPGSIELQNHDFTIQIDRSSQENDYFVDDNYYRNMLRFYVPHTPPPPNPTPHPQRGIDNDDVELAQIQDSDTVIKEFIAPRNPDKRRHAQNLRQRVKKEKLNFNPSQEIDDATQDLINSLRPSTSSPTTNFDDLQANDPLIPSQQGINSRSLLHKYYEFLHHDDISYSEPTFERSGTLLSRFYDFLNGDDHAYIKQCATAKEKILDTLAEILGRKDKKHN